MNKIGDLLCAFGIHAGGWSLTQKLRDGHGRAFVLRARRCQRCGHHQIQRRNGK